MNTLLNKIKGLRGVQGAHAVSFAGRPWPWPKDSRFEVLAWILSILEYRRNVGPIDLYYNDDPATVRVIDKLGIDKLYDNVWKIAPGPLIDTQRFWAWPKIAALRQMRAPCCLLDIDAVLRKRTPLLWADVTALHSEPREWDIYSCPEGADLRRRMTAWIHKYGGVAHLQSAHPDPSNTAVIAFMSESARREYTEIAERMMAEESYDPTVHIDINSGPGSSLIQMVTVEQLMLSELCARMAYSLGYLTELDTSVRYQEHVQWNETVMHLWNSKRHYSARKSARMHFEDWAQIAIAAVGGYKSDGVWGVLRAAGYGLPIHDDPNTGQLYLDRERLWSGGPGESIRI